MRMRAFVRTTVLAVPTIPSPRVQAWGASFACTVLLSLGACGSASSTSSSTSDASASASTEGSSGDELGTGECLGDDIVCGEFCTDPSEDLENCGACGVTCELSEGCFDGVCTAATCTDPQVSCVGACVDASADVDNCGACGVACEYGETCSAGACDCGSPLSFAIDVAPLLDSDCNGSNCHSAASSKADLDLSGDAHAALVGIATQQCDGARTLVEPGSPDNSYLINKLRGQGMCQGVRMPRNEDPYSPDQTQLIARWICQGALDN